VVYHGCALVVGAVVGNLCDKIWAAAPVDVDPEVNENPGTSRSLARQVTFWRIPGVKVLSASQ
jgi:hypothetical protein